MLRTCVVCYAASMALPLLFASQQAFANENKVTVSAPIGEIVGLKQSSGIQAFKGIRYGADTGPRRFQPALPAPKSDTPIKAMGYGPDCPQRGSENYSEDCLFLNIWTPAASAVKRPVIIYIHGGAYSHGSGSDALYDGTRLARKGDVVVVTLNHRLGFFGYAYFNQLKAPKAWELSGNAGQLDLLLALRWVKKNIGAFGGDAENITLVGQSGGGAKIATLMAMPEAKGLFHKAMSMSGQQVTASGPMNATKRMQAFMETLGLAQPDISTLGTMPVAELLAATTTADPILANKRLYFGPVLDMKSLKQHPFYPGAAAQSANIPMIIGNTLDETRLFLTGNPAHHTLTWDSLPDFLARNIPVDIDPFYVRDTYRQLFPSLSPSEIFFKATTAGRSWRAAIIEAEERAKQGSPTWVYQLNWQSPKDGGKWRAPHTIDIPLIFMTTDVPHALTGDSAEARQMAQLMSDRLIAFARTGTPNLNGAPNWPVFTLPKRQTLILDLPQRIEEDPRGAERRLFETVPYIQPGS